MIADEGLDLVLDAPVRAIHLDGADVRGVDVCRERSRPVEVVRVPTKRAANAASGGDALHLELPVTGEAPLLGQCPFFVPNPKRRCPLVLNQPMLLSPSRRPMPPPKLACGNRVG